MVCRGLLAVEVNDRVFVLVRAVDAKGIAVSTKACRYASSDKRGFPTLNMRRDRGQVPWRADGLAVDFVNGTRWLRRIRGIKSPV